MVFEQCVLQFCHFCFKIWLVYKNSCRMSCIKDKLVLFFPRKLKQQTVLLPRFERNRMIIIMYSMLNSTVVWTSFYIENVEEVCFVLNIPVFFQCAKETIKCFFKLIIIDLFNHSKSVIHKYFSDIDCTYIWVGGFFDPDLLTGAPDNQKII